MSDLQTYIITGTFGSVTEMVKHLQSEDYPVTVRANLDYKAGGDLIHAELCEDSCIGWHDAKAVATALGVTEDE